MALKNASSLGSRVLSVALPCSRGKAVRGFFVLLTFLSCPLSARAQLQQPFVFAVDTAGPNPGILVFTRNDATGVLTPVPGSPFPSKAPVNLLALDFNGRFLFVGTSTPIPAHSRKFQTRRLPPRTPHLPCFSPPKAAASFFT